MEWEAIDHREQEDENENDMMTRRRPKKLVSASDQTLEEEDEKEEEDQQPGSSTTTTDEQEKQHSELQEDEDDDAGETFISPPPSSLSSSSPSPPSSPPPPPKRYAPLPCPVADDATRLEKPVRVYADGIYDLFHFGHARSLEQAKKSFPNTYLLVGCCSDALTNKYKGKTVMNEAERYESLRHCKWVDEVIEDAPWVITNEFLDEHQIDYVAHDSLPYADASGTGNDVYAFVKAAGKFKETKRTDGVSTSDLIMRILKDYNQYVMRNLARGYTRKDLGVSYVKEKQLQVNMRISKLRQKVKEQQERVGQRLNTVANAADLIDWVENADRWVSGFLEKFEEGCHFMESAIKSQIQKGLLMQQNQFILRSNNKLMNGRVEASRQIH